MLTVYDVNTTDQLEKFISNSMNQKQNVGWSFERVNPDSYKFPMKFVVVSDSKLKLSTVMPLGAA